MLHQIVKVEVYVPEEIQVESVDSDKKRNLVGCVSDKACDQEH